ncbi:MAG: GDP-L-fucose synthase [Geminicoccaceae bacterium]
MVEADLGSTAPQRSGDDGQGFRAAGVRGVNPFSFELYPLHGRRIFIAGHRGMVGSALCRRLASEPVELLTASRGELDLTSQAAVRSWMQANRPDVVVLAAARVGGILANASRPVAFLEDNLLIELNVIRAAFEAGVEKLLFLGSSCIYPKHAEQPIREDALLTGALEPTNQWYALAKIAGVKLCEAYRREYAADFISAMPTNLYGPGDNFDPQASHVLPALLRRIHEAMLEGAESVTIWGTGTPRREFLHVDDLADACVHLLRHHSGHEPVNIGCGSDLSIIELARMIARIAGYRGEILTDPSMPDGTPRKLLDTSRMSALGWQPRIPLEEGIAATWRWYLEHIDGSRGRVRQERVLEGVEA